MPDVVTKELKVRAYVDAQTGQLKVFEADMDKVGKAVDAATKKVQQQEKVLDRQNKALNNTRDSLIRNQAAFSGLSQAAGGTVGNLLAVTNQIEDFEYQAKRSGQSINLFKSSLGGATSAIGGLGVAALAVGALMAGWKIGTWIANQEVFGKKIGQTTDYLIDLGSMAKEDEDRLRAMNDQLAQSLWEKYGIQVKMAGLSILEANKALLAAASAANQANIAINNALKDININAAKLSNDFILQQMSAADRIVEIERQKGELKIKMQNSVSQKFIEQYKNEIKELDQLAASATSEYQGDQENAAKERISLAEQTAKKIEAAAKAEYDAFKKYANEELKERQDLAKAIQDLDKEREQAAAEELQAEHQILGEWQDEMLQARENFNNAVLDGALERIEREKAALAELAEYEKQTLLDRLSQWSNFFGEIGSMIGGIGGGAMGAIGSGIGTYTNVLEKVFKGEKDMFGKSLTSANAWAAGIGAAFDGLANVVGGAAGKILDAVGAIAMGFAQGGWIGAAIAAVGVLTNALAGLFQHDWAEDAANQVDILIDGLKVSAELMEKITADAKEFGNAQKAALMNLPAIFDEMGVSLENFYIMAQSAQDVLSGIEQGILSVEEASEILNQILPQLFDAAIQGGEEYMARLEEILQMTKQAGIDISSVVDMIASKVAEMQSALMEQLQVFTDNMTPVLEAFAARVDAMWAKTAPVSMDQFDALERQATGYAGAILQTFNAALLAGKSIAEAIALIQPNIDALGPALTALGLTWASVGAGWIKQLSDINKRFPEQVGLINAVTGALQAARIAGIEPTQAAFRAMQKTAVDAFKDITGSAKPSKAELLQFLPTLYQLAAASEQFGLTLDPQIAKYIQMAKEAGVWDAEAYKATQNQTKGIGDLVSAFTDEPDGLIPTLKKFIEMLAALNGMTVTTTVVTEYVDEDKPDGDGPPPPPPPHHQPGGSGNNPFQIGGNQERGMNAGIGGGGGNTYNINVYGGDPNQLRQRILQMQRDGEI